MKFRMQPIIFIHKIDFTLKNMEEAINFGSCIVNLNLCYNYFIIQFIGFLVHYYNSIINKGLKFNLDRLKFINFDNLKVLYFHSCFEDYTNILKQEEMKQFNLEEGVKVNFNILEVMVKVNNLIKFNWHLTKVKLLNMVFKLLVDWWYNYMLMLMLMWLNIRLFMVKEEKYRGYYFNINYQKNPKFVVKEQTNKDFVVEHRYFNYYNYCKLPIMVIIINMNSIRIKIINIMNQSYLIIDLCMINMDLQMVIKNHIMNLQQY